MLVWSYWAYAGINMCMIVTFQDDFFCRFDF